jgi:hypothetical protein
MARSGVDTPRAVLVALLLAGCASTTGSPVTLADGSGALRWGDGPYGLVLVHDAGHDAAAWGPQAAAFAERGMSVVAVERAEPDAITQAISGLRDAGVERVALLAAGDGTVAAMTVGRVTPDLVDQLVLVSATGDATGLGVFPKLFVASTEEPAAADAERMAGEAPGDWNALYLAIGGGSGQAIFSGASGADVLDAVLQRLAERR